MIAKIGLRLEITLKRVDNRLCFYINVLRLGKNTSWSYLKIL